MKKDNGMWWTRGGEILSASFCIALPARHGNAIATAFWPRMNADNWQLQLTTEARGAGNCNCNFNRSRGLHGSHEQGNGKINGNRNCKWAADERG
jgi:hypothetical protein